MSFLQSSELNLSQNLTQSHSLKPYTPITPQNQHKQPKHESPQYQLIQRVENQQPQLTPELQLQQAQQSFETTLNELKNVKSAIKQLKLANKQQTTKWLENEQLKLANEELITQLKLEKMQISLSIQNQNQNIQQIQVQINEFEQIFSELEQSIRAQKLRINQQKASFEGYYEIVKNCIKMPIPATLLDLVKLEETLKLVIKNMRE